MFEINRADAACKTYRPDFLIDNTTIVEVKPSGLVDFHLNRTKKQKCIEQYPQYEYKFLTEADFNTDLNMFYADIDAGLVVVDIGKRKKLKGSYASII